MVEAASLGVSPPPVTSRVECDPFPLQDLDWAESAELTWGAAIYVEVCAHYTDLSVTALRDIVKNGTAPAQAAGGLVRSARQLQKLHLGEPKCARDFI